jgi:hypothetical protein
VRTGVIVWLTVASAMPTAAQFAEPILTRTAIPEPLGDTSLQLMFVSPLSQGTSQALPQARLDIGLGGGFETTLQMPLLRVTEPNGGSVLGAGQISVALQYLLAGSQSADYAISLATRVEVPSGDSRIAGNETQIMPTVLVEWRARPGLVFRSAISWDRTVAGTTGKFAFFEYDNALSWMNKSGFVPTIEIAGSTETFHGSTQVAIQPEIIFARIRNVELKFGISREVVSTTRYEIRAELAWFRGKESTSRHL